MNCFLIFKIKLAELKKPATTILKRQCTNKGKKTGFSTLLPLGLTNCVFDFLYHNSDGLADSRTLKNCQKNHRPIFYLRKYVGQNNKPTHSAPMHAVPCTCIIFSSNELSPMSKSPLYLGTIHKDSPNHSGILHSRKTKRVKKPAPPGTNGFGIAAGPEFF